MSLKEEIKKILEEYASQMICCGFDTIYNDDEEIDKVVELIMNVINDNPLTEPLK